MSSKSHSSRFLAILVILLAISPLVFVAGTNYIVDPLQIYRQQRWVEPRFWSEQRSQNAGKIRNYLAQGGYDSIIIGNSVADNFRPNRVAEALGWKKVLKLTVDAGQATEQAFILEQALAHASIKHVLWCNRVNNVMGKKEVAWNPKRAMPFYLYSASPFDDSPYLFSMDSFAFSWRQLLGISDWEQDLDRLNYWQSSGHIMKQLRYNSPSNLKKFRQQEIGVKCGTQFYFNDKYKYPSLDHNLLRIVRKYPSVEFHIVFAPATRQSISIKDHNFLSGYFGVQRSIVLQTERLSNVKIYGFENDDLIVNNLANYRDSHHYHSGINEYMLQAIKHGDNRLTATDIDSYINKVSDKLCHFEVHSDFETMIPLALSSENIILRNALANQTIFTQLDRAREFLKKKEYPPAIIALDKVFMSDNLDKNYLADAYKLRAAAYYQTNKFDLAISDYTKAIEFKPDKAWLYVDRGRCLWRVKKFEEAKNDFLRSIELRPDHYLGYFLAGNAMAREKKYLQAIDFYTKAIKKEPKLAILYTERGKMYGYMGQVTKAQDDYAVVNQLKL